MIIGESELQKHVEQWCDLAPSPFDLSPERRLALDTIVEEGMYDYNPDGQFFTIHRDYHDAPQPFSQAHDSRY